MKISFKTFNPFLIIKKHIEKMKFERYKKQQIKELKPRVENIMKKYQPWQDEYFKREYLQKQSIDIFEKYKKQENK